MPPAVNPDLPVIVDDIIHITIGARIRNFVTNWDALTQCSWIRQSARGVFIPLIEEPIQRFVPFPLRMPQEEMEILDGEVLKLLQKGVIRHALHTKGEFLSNIFLRPKPNGDFRLILDLTKFNEFVEYQHFKMFSLATARDLLLPGAFMASIDLRDAYYTIPIAEEHCKFLRFLWRGELFEFICMPNGLAAAPRIFTRILKPVFSKLSEKGFVLFPYIDDSFVVAETDTECSIAVNELAALLKSLGFIIHVEKSVFQPTQKLKFLGFFLDSVNMLVHITPDKVEKFKNFVLELGSHGQKLKIRRVAVIIGLMTAYSPAVLYGSAHIKTLEIAKNKALFKARGDFEKLMVIPEIAWIDIDWWVRKIDISPCPIRLGKPDMEITTDASLQGWGAHTKHSGTGGRWLLTEGEAHINVLELKAVGLGLRSLISSQNLHVHVKTDNLTTLAYIRNMGGSKSPECNAVAKCIWEWAENRNIWLTVGYIPGKENILADEFSRNFKDHLEWSLNDIIFDSIVNNWGRPQVDLFASRRNFKVPKFVSWHPEPEAWRVDAFTFQWDKDYMYAFPPFSLVGRVARKLFYDKAHAILVAPTWTTQPWYAAAMKWSKQVMLFPREQHNLLHQGPLTEKGDVGSTPMTAFLFYEIH